MCTDFTGSPPLSRKKVGKEQDQFWLPLCTPPPTLWRGSRGRSVLGFHCPALGCGAESVFRVLVAFWMLGFWFSHRWWDACIVFHLPQKNHWAEKTAWWISRSCSKKCPVRTLFRNQVCGKGWSSPGHVGWETVRMLKLVGKTRALSNNSPTTFRLYPMIF